MGSCSCFQFLRKSQPPALMSSAVELPCPAEVETLDVKMDDALLAEERTDSLATMSVETVSLDSSSSLSRSDGRSDIEPVEGQAQFLRDEVSFGDRELGPKSGQGRLGYSMPAELLESRPVQLWPIPADATLADNGFELLSITEALRGMGVTEENFDPTSQDHRCKVGSALIGAAQARFGKRAIHLADTSRVSGSAVYGEATVRDTRAGSKLRAAQHIFHMDKFLPGIAKLYGHTTESDGARRIADAYWHLWEPDFNSFGVTKDAALSYIAGAAPGMLNLWVSLTPGEVINEPLAVADMRNILLDDSDIDLVSTHKVVFPGLEDTITVLRQRAIDGAKLMFRPRMRFGEVIMFSTTHTPHSAVWLPNAPTPGRCSAEMRMLMATDLDREA